MKKFKVVVNGEVFEVDVEEISSGKPSLNVQQGAALPRPAAKPSAANNAPAPEPKPESKAPEAPKAAAPAGVGDVLAPMPGNINAVRVKPGDQVKEGDILLVLEAMKMENEITAPMAGTIKDVKVETGQAVANGDLLVVIG